jgi:hypothetical protein
MWLCKPNPNKGFTSDQKWLLTDYESRDDVLIFSTLDAQISLAEIYAQVEFKAAIKLA